jgi:hypothetical protein
VVDQRLEPPIIGEALRADGVDGNARLTGSIGAAIFVLLAIEGVTVLQVHQLLTLHVFIGVLITAFVVTKLGTVAYRFARYYLGDPAYVRKGPPHIVLRVAGPFVVVTTVVLLATGIAGLAAGRSDRWLIDIHRTTFWVWFAAMTIHVLGHAFDTPKLAIADWEPPALAGRSARRFLLVVTLVTGLVVAYAVVTSGWLAGWHHFAHR